MTTTSSAVAEDMLPLEERVSREVEEASLALEVTEPESPDAGEVLRSAGAVYARLEKERKAAKQPYLDLGRAVDQAFAPLKGLKKAIDTLRNSLARIEAEREAARKLEMEALLERARAGELVDVPAPPPERATRTKTAWKYKVVDLSKVPRKWLTLDEKAVKAAIDAGERKINGLEIYEDIIVTRVSGKGGE